MTILRPFRSEDLETLYAISLATGLEGGDASALHVDPRLIGHIYSAPYALLEPDLALVATDEIGVAGFAVGTLDTVAWAARLERDWWPALRRTYVDPGEAASDADRRRIAMIRQPAAVPTAVTSTHPAHLHLNLLPRAQGRGLGTRLLSAWLEKAVQRGAGGVHVGVNRGNARALGFWGANGFTDLFPGESSGRTLWMGRTLRAQSRDPSSRRTRP